MYLQTKINFLRQSFHRLEYYKHTTQTHRYRQTDRQTDKDLYDCKHYHANNF